MTKPTTVQGQARPEATAVAVDAKLADAEERARTLAGIMDAEERERTLASVRDAADAAYELIVRLAESAPPPERAFAVHREAMETARRFFDNHVAPLDRPGGSEDYARAEALAERLRTLAGATAPVVALPPAIVQDVNPEIRPVVTVRWDCFVGPVVEAVSPDEIHDPWAGGFPAQRLAGYDAAEVALAAQPATLYGMRAEIRARGLLSTDAEQSLPVVGPFPDELHARHVFAAAEWLRATGVAEATTSAGA